MVSPAPTAPTKPLQADPPAHDEPLRRGHILRVYGFQLFALLLGIALAIL